jgi:hypothetical protein
LALVAQTPALLAREEEHRPHAVTWLNQERFNDEPSPPQRPNGKPNNAYERDQQRRDDLNAGLKAFDRFDRRKTP